MDQIVFWIGIGTPAAIVLAVFTTLLLIQEKAAEPARPAPDGQFSKPTTAPEQEHLND